MWQERERNALDYEAGKDIESWMLRSVFPTTSSMGSGSYELTVSSQLREGLQLPWLVLSPWTNRCVQGCEELWLTSPVSCAHPRGQVSYYKWKRSVRWQRYDRWDREILLSPRNEKNCMLNDIKARMPVLCFFFKNLFYFLKCFIYLFLERGEGREKEGERSINVWLPLAQPPLGTWPVTQACAPTGNQTDIPSVHRPAFNPLSHTSQGPTSLFFFLD